MIIYLALKNYFRIFPHHKTEDKPCQRLIEISLVFPFGVGVVFTSEKNAMIQKEILWLKSVLQTILAVTLQDAHRFILHLK